MDFPLIYPAQSHFISMTWNLILRRPLRPYSLIFFTLILCCMTFNVCSTCEFHIFICQYHVPGSLDGKASAYNVGDLGSILGLGRSPGEGKGYPLQYSGLENSMDFIVHAVAESDTTEKLSLHFTSYLILGAFVLILVDLIMLEYP